MALSAEMCSVLALGVDKEQAAHAFYLQAAEKTQSILGKRMFTILAGEEAKHEQLLASWSSMGACPPSPTFSEEARDLLARGKVKLEKDVRPSTGDLEAVEIGRDMERKAIAYYAVAAAQAVAAVSKDLLRRLEAEEKKHLVLLSDLYEYMKDPKLWSVRDERSHFDA